MNKSQLETLLKSARLPERPAEYWHGFPSSVTRALARNAGTPPPAIERPRSWLFQHPALSGAFALGCACLVVAFAVRVHRFSAAPRDNLAAAERYYTEIASLFPNQVREIVLDKNGPRFQLSDHPDRPGALPVLLNVCTRNGCQSIVTFSGQQIRVDGKALDVLVGARNEVIVASDDGVWTSTERGRSMDGFRVEAKAL